MKFKEYIRQTHVIVSVLTVVLVALVTAQNLLLSDFGYATEMRSFYNNYLIFKNSFFNLIDHNNLYVLYREVQTDLFKYSPTFALGFGVFGMLPDAFGLFFWNLVNTLVFYGIWQLKLPGLKNKFLIWLYLIVEFVTNVQSSQSNGLMAGLMILAYVFLERKNVALATLMVVMSIYLKLFGIVAFALFLFYPDKVKAITYSAIWMILLFVVPLVAIPGEELMAQYQNWWAMLQADKPVAHSLSVMGWLKYWFNVLPSGGMLTGVGVLMFLAPFTQIKKYSNPVFRQLILASLLIWVVLFNHKAESPTFIIAIAGVAIWYFSQPKSSVNLALLISTVLFTQLAPTDLYPSSLRETYFIPYVIKVFPVILVWIKVLYDSLWTVKPLEVES